MKMIKANEHNDWDAKYEPGPPARLWLRLPYLPPSLNVWSRQHWSKRHKVVASLTRDLIFLLHSVDSWRERTIPCFSRATVQITYYFRDHRRRDPDNYGGKQILDSLRYAGILADDDAKSISLPQPEFRVDAKAPRTEIVLDGRQDKGE